MTASGDPAVCIRFAISRDPLDESCDDLCEWAPPDILDIAESIDDVLGGALPISTRCCGAVAAIGGRILVGEPPEGFEFRIGSDTLREVPFVSLGVRPYLFIFISFGQAVPPV
jgi:hypothetical protein